MLPPGDLAARSRWAERHLEDIPETADPLELERALVRHGFTEAVVFPCSDTWAQAVARMPDQMKARYPASIAAPHVLDTLVDKALFCDATERLRCSSSHDACDLSHE